MQFDVTVQRVEYKEHVFRVEAEDYKAAEQAGLEASCDYNFGDTGIDSANESVTSVVAVYTPRSQVLMEAW